ncbi:hypothetical protein O1L60_39865 [Streptomyces diastatochromogenes]|nr:hypothetical protein [Streptomyces diastatochromogenes]
MSAPTRRRRWLTICAITASAGLVAIPASAAPGGHSDPFGVRALDRLAKERQESVGVTSPTLAGTRATTATRPTRSPRAPTSTPRPAPRPASSHRARTVPPGAA